MPRIQSVSRRALSRRVLLRLLPLTLGGALVVAACTAPHDRASQDGARSSADSMSGMPGMADTAPHSPGRASATGMTVGDSMLPGMPPPLDPTDLYAADRPGALSPVVRNDRPADLRTEQRQRHGVGHRPGHLQGDPDGTGAAQPRARGAVLGPAHPVGQQRPGQRPDARSTRPPAQFGTPVPVNDPYNLYFTPDGKFAMVMSEAAHQIVFRDPHTMAIAKTVPGGLRRRQPRRLLAGRPVLHRQLRVLRRPAQGGHATAGGRRRSCTCPRAHAMPQDVKISPDGKTWYVADMQTSGVWILDGDQFTTPTFLPTGDGAHGLYVSRDSKSLYITNRGEGSISRARLRHQARWSPSGRSPAAAARTWAASPPTARCCGCPAGTTARSTPSTPPTGT